MTTTTERHDPRQLFERMVQTAQKIQATGAFEDADIATCFFSVGLAFARHAHGPVTVAELLRDMADEVERGGLTEAMH